MEDLGSHYEARYQCGPDEKQTEVRVIENEWRDRVLWSYVVRPGGIMCRCIRHPVTNLPMHIFFSFNNSFIDLGPLKLRGQMRRHKNYQ